MAFDKTIPADQNPIGTTPVDVYARDARIERDTAANYAQATWSGYTDRAAYEAGKQPITQFNGVAFGPQPTPARHDAQSGALVAPARPAWPDVRAVFAAEFDYVDAVFHVLAERYDPQLQDATPAEPLPDAATMDEIRARLDAAGITGFGTPRPAK